MRTFLRGAARVIGRSPRTAADALVGLSRTSRCLISKASSSGSRGPAHIRPGIVELGMPICGLCRAGPALPRNAILDILRSAMLLLEHAAAFAASTHAGKNAQPPRAANDGHPLPPRARHRRRDSRRTARPPQLLGRARQAARVGREGPRAPRGAGLALRIPAHGAARPGAPIGAAPSAGDVFRQFQRAGHHRPSAAKRRGPGTRQIGPPFRAHRKGQTGRDLKMPSIAFLWDAAAKATTILAAAWLLTLALRHQSAATRYFTWTCALGAALAVPAISPLLPRWEPRVKTPAIARGVV